MVAEITRDIRERGRDKVPFPRVSRSIMAVAFSWLITLLILFFDTTQQIGGPNSDVRIVTNPVVFFSIPLIFLFIFMPKDSWESIRVTLGIDLNTGKTKIVAIISALAGISAGLIGNYFMTNAGIIPLHFSTLITTTLAATATPVLTVVLFHGVVAFFEESYSVMYFKISSNVLHERNFRGILLLFGGMAVSRGFWASLHWFAYSGWLGFQTWPLFFIAWILGMLFSILGVAFGSIVGKAYLHIPAVFAHWSYNVAVQLNLMMILPLVIAT